MPVELSHLGRLQELGLRGNELKTLPVELSKLENIRWLDLRDNPQLRALPAAFESLRGRVLSDNPIVLSDGNSPGKLLELARLPLDVQAGQAISLPRSCPEDDEIRRGLDEWANGESLGLRKLAIASKTWPISLCLKYELIGTASKSKSQCRCPTERR